MYVPHLRTIADQQALRAVIRANQFPADPTACSRTLVLYDDALTAGLGYTARLISLALLVAVQEKRVLVMVKHGTARWCARPPYTLGCYYEPITHCPMPDGHLNMTKWSTRGSSQGLDKRRETSAPAVRISTSQIHRSTFWYKFHPPQELHAATHELLFRPRAWVENAATCVMRAASLESGSFAVVHARFSAEKKKERGNKLPQLAEYLKPTVALLSKANATRLFLQTSTPDAIDLFEKWSVERHWHLSYTQNARSAHDLWMVGKGTERGKAPEYAASGERISVVAQSVNALIASRSRHFLSPSSSMWTAFIRALMGRRVSDRVYSFDESEDVPRNDTCRELWYSMQKECFGSGCTGGGNVTREDQRRCRRPTPQLLEIHRSPMRQPSTSDDAIERSI